MPLSKALFEYRLRESARARHVRLRVTPREGLEIVVPKGYNPARIPRILEQKQAWIRAALEHARSTPAPVWELPREISFPAIGRQWRLDAQASDAPGVWVRETGPGQLSIKGRIADESAGRAALTRWLARQAGAHLPPRLAELSGQLGLAFHRVYIKQQRSRWGSCSHRRAISLNAKLLFLDPALVRYVMVHELCHLAQMNHSKRFWSLVQRHHAEFRAHDRALREAWKSLPRWAC